MSGRLQGLSKRRFAPKSVVRRSKEDREASAPAVKPESSEPEPSKAEQPEQRRRREVRISVPTAEATAGYQRRGGSGPSGRSAGGRATAGRFSGSATQTAPPLAGSNGHATRSIDVSDPMNASPFFPVNIAAIKPEVSERKTQLELPGLLNISALSLDPKKLGFAKDNKDEGTVKMEIESSEPEISTAGRIGTIRKHKSGKITLVINDKVYEMAPSIPCSSVEEAILLDKNTMRAAQVGPLSERLVLLPEI